VAMINRSAWMVWGSAALVRAASMFMGLDMLILSNQSIVCFPAFFFRSLEIS
jgi:hypothetical protein